MVRRTGLPVALLCLASVLYGLPAPASADPAPPARRIRAVEGGDVGYTGGTSVSQYRPTGTAPSGTTGAPATATDTGSGGSGSSGGTTITLPLTSSADAALALGSLSGLSLNIPSTDGLIFPTSATEQSQGEPFPQISGVGTTGSIDEGTADVTPCVLYPVSDVSGYFETTRVQCDAWNRLQDKAVDEVIATRGLVVDRTLALQAARGEVRTQLYLTLVKALVTPAAKRTADEATIVEWFAQVMKRYQIAVAQQTLAEFTTFDKDNGYGSCTYTPPAPYQADYPGSGGRWPNCRKNSTLSTLFSALPKYPSAEEFVKWGTAAANVGLTDPQVAGVQGQISTALAATLAGGAVGGAVGATMLGISAFAPAASQAIIGAIAPYVAQSLVELGLASSIAGASQTWLATLAGPVGAIIAVSLIILIYSITDFMSRDKLREQFQSAVATAKTTTPDVASLATTQNGLATILSMTSIWLGLQHGADPTPSAVPPRRYDDGAFRVDGTRAASFTAVGWDGKQHTTSLRSGYFVTDGVPSISLSYLDPAGVQRRAYRLRQGGKWVWDSVVVDGSLTSCTGATTSGCQVTSALRMRRAPLGSPDTSTLSVELVENQVPKVDQIDGPTRVEAAQTPVRYRVRPTDQEGDPLAVTWAVQRYPSIVAGKVVDPCIGALPADRIAPSLAQPLPSCFVTAATGTPELTTSFDVAGSYRVRARLDDGVGVVERELTTTVLEAPFRLAPALQCGSAAADKTYCTGLETRYGGVLRASGVVTEPDANDTTTVVVDWGGGVTTRSTYPCSPTTTPCAADVSWQVTGATRRFVATRTSAPVGAAKVDVLVTDGRAGRRDGFANAYTVTPAVPVVALDDATTPATADEGSPLVVTGTVTSGSSSTPFNLTVDTGRGVEAIRLYPCSRLSTGCPSDIAFTPTANGVRFTYRRTFGDDTRGTLRIGVAEPVGGAVYQTATRPYLIADVAPTVTLDPPPAGTPVIGSRQPFTGHVSDPGTDDQYLATLTDTDGRRSRLPLVPAAGGGYDLAGTYTAANADVRVEVTDRRTGATGVDLLEISAANPTYAVPIIEPPIGIILTRSARHGARRAGADSIIDLPTGADGLPVTSGPALPVHLVASSAVDVIGTRAWIDERPAEGAAVGGVALPGEYGSGDVDVTAAIGVQPLAEGRHVLYVTAIDEFGRTSPLQAFPFVIDRTGPVFSADSTSDTVVGLADDSGSAEFTPSVSATDRSPVTGTASAVAVACDPAGALDLSFAAPVEVACTATDVAGNATEYSFAVGAVNAPGAGPSVTRPAPAGGSIAFQVTRGASRLRSVAAAIDDDAPTPLALPADTASPQAFSLPVPATGLDDGEHRFTVLAIDAGGRSVTRTATFVIDRRGPVFESRPPLIVRSSSADEGRVVRFVAPPAVDAVDGQRPASCAPASGSYFPLGDTVVTCTASDAASHTTSTTFTVRVLPPGVAPTGEYLDVPDVVGGDELPVEFSASTTAPGTSIAGGYLAIAPTLDATTDYAGVGTNPDDEVDIDEDAGTAHFVARRSVRSLPDGTYRVGVLVTDTAGRQSTVGVRTVRIDRTAPLFRTQGTINAVASTADGVVLAYTVGADDAGDGGPSPVACFPESGSVFPIGTTQVTCTSADLAGNESSTTFDVVVAPPGSGGAGGGAAAPSASVDALPARTSATTLRVGGTALAATAALSVQGVRAWVDTVTGDGTVLVLGPGAQQRSFAGTLDISGLAEGRHTLIVRVTDSAGTTAERTLAFVVDRTAPLVTVPAAALATADTAAGTVVDFEPTAVDPGGDGVLAPVCVPASGSVFPVGTTTVTCTATDAAGNLGTATFPVTVAPPVDDPSVSLDGLARFVRAGVLEVRGSAQALAEGVTVTGARAWIDRVRGAGQALSLETSGSRVTLGGALDVRRLAEGAHTLIVRVTDSRGRTAAVRAAFTVDRTAPTLRPRANVRRILLGQQGVSVAPGARDSGSGVAAARCSSVDTSVAGLQTVRCSARDLAGNVGRARLRVLVRDVLSPTDRTTLVAGRSTGVELRLTDVDGGSIGAARARALSRDCAVTVRVVGVPADGDPLGCLVWNAATASFVGAVRPAADARGPARLVYAVAYGANRSVRTTRTVRIVGR